MANVMIVVKVLSFFLTFRMVLSLQYNYVTCGSVIKLLNTRYSVRLHSNQEFKYGTGSGQQAVTGVNSQIESGSNWQIKGNTTRPCSRGTTIRCGQTIRLENLDTRKNLHSHHYPSPISDGQEISTFGENGVGDKEDNWETVCEGSDWIREETVMFRHATTRVYLEATGQKYTDPLQGHMEIIGSMWASAKGKWKTAEGVYISPAEPIVPNPPVQHTEL